jgi:hypothetical protein
MNLVYCTIPLILMVSAASAQIGKPDGPFACAYESESTNNVTTNAAATNLEAEVKARGYGGSAPIESLPRMVMAASECPRHYDWKKYLYYNMGGLRASQRGNGLTLFKGDNLRIGVIDDDSHDYQRGDPLAVKFLRFVEFRKYRGDDGFAYSVPIFEHVK